MGAAPLIRVVRNGLEESLHQGHVAVCDADGRLVAWAGEPDRVVFIRSCTKPVQAAVSLAAIGDERLSSSQVAVMCSSHNGEQVHVRGVRSILRRAGLPEGSLRTPPARPQDASSARGVSRPAPIYHNCSGKHAGMLLASVRAGWPAGSYTSRGHALQRRVLGAVRSLTGEDPVLGIDGCGVPVHGVSLRAIATMYARLAQPDRTGDLAPQVARATAAMRAHPYLVGGRGRDDTAVMEATDDVLMKEGAEALNCAASPAAGLGVAVKIADGGYRAAGPATAHVLDRLGMLDGAARRALRGVLDRRVLGGGRPQGRYEPVLELRLS
jgi:L-asparaginase II